MRSTALFSVVAGTMWIAAIASQCLGQVSTQTASFAEFDRRATEGAPLSVVFFGGSLTWGANASDPNITSWRGLMMQYLRERYPKASFAFYDAAIGGTGSRLGMFRLERDVLSRKPDLVFLDFSVNDDADHDNLDALPSYEYVLRRMVEGGIPVVQSFFAFRYHLEPGYNGHEPPRFAQHRKLAEAYNTATANAFALLRERLRAGTITLDEIWPIDGSHPDDAGYRLFFEAVRDGFDSAIGEKRICRAPAQAVYSEPYRQVSRIRPADLPIPTGWHRDRTYRTSFWYDGLSSRWMGDVLACDAAAAGDARPITVEFSGTLVGIFGEADQDGLAFRAKIDGKPVANPKPAAGTPSDLWPTTVRMYGIGRLFFWRELAISLAPGKHVLEIWPATVEPGGKGQLRIESICIAGQ